MGKLLDFVRRSSEMFREIIVWHMKAQIVHIHSRSNTRQLICGDLIFVLHSPIYHLRKGNVAILNKLFHVLAVISRIERYRL
jgi:hypothetical protein